MKTTPQTFFKQLADMMRSTGKSYSDCAAILGRRGGFVAGRNRAAKSKALFQERRKQEAMGIR
jgi:hypothetical protein